MESPSAEPIKPENLPMLDSLRRVFSGILQAEIFASDSTVGSGAADSTMVGGV